MEIEWKDYKKALNDSLIYYGVSRYGIEKYFENFMRMVQREFGFFLIEVNEDTGVILYSPETQEIYREIPKTEDWMHNILKFLTNYGD